LAEFKLFKSIYHLYTNDLSYSEFERLIKREAPEIYSFYSAEVKPLDLSKNKVSRTFTFLKNIFIVFLLKLNPARRLIYSIALFIFFYGYLYGLWGWSVLAFLALNGLLAFELADKLSAKDELDVARKIQSNLMPKAPPTFERYDVACYTEPAREVGGDYFDFITLDKEEENCLVIVGDISGKGMAAALYMVQVQAILHHLINFNSEIKQILIQLNKNLYRILKREFFFTSGVVNISKSDELTICRAGHMPFIYYCSEAKKCSQLIPQGIGLGLTDKAIFSDSLKVDKLKMKSGDILLVFTDGVTETMNMLKQQFGDARLLSIIESNAHKSATEIEAAILRAINQFKRDASPHDDLTFVILKAR
jgi:serine phosphatase RsbU (regulator of sigma subunit)